MKLFGKKEEMKVKELAGEWKRPWGEMPDFKLRWTWEDRFDEVLEKLEELEKEVAELRKMAVMMMFGVKIKGVSERKVGNTKQVDIILDVFGNEVKVGVLLGDEPEPKEIRWVWPKERDGRGLC